MPSRVRAVWAASALCLLSLGISACSDNPEPIAKRQDASGEPLRTVTGPETVSTADGLHVVVAGAMDGAGDMAAPGVISKVGMCLGLRVGTTELVAVWPSGTRVSTGREVKVQLPGGQTFGMGDPIRASGGMVEADQNREMVPETRVSCGGAFDRMLVGGAE